MSAQRLFKRIPQLPFAMKMDMPSIAARHGITMQRLLHGLGTLVLAEQQRVVHSPKPQRTSNKIKCQQRSGFYMSWLNQAIGTVST